LLLSAEQDAGFLASLRHHCQQQAVHFSPEKEAAGIQSVIAECAESSFSPGVAPHHNDAMRP
jgi:hypothetical protein